MWVLIYVNILTKHFHELGPFYPVFTSQAHWCPRQRRTVGKTHKPPVKIRILHTKLPWNVYSFRRVSFLLNLKVLFHNSFWSGHFKHLTLTRACFGSPLFSVGAKSMPSKTCPAQSRSVYVLVFRIRCSRKVLVIHLHPVDVCKCLAIHFVNEQAALQVVHLVLDDASCPPTGLPHHLLSSGVQPCKGSYSLGEDMLNCIILNLLTLSLPLDVPMYKRQHQKGTQYLILPKKKIPPTLPITK